MLSPGMLDLLTDLASGYVIQTGGDDEYFVGDQPVDAGLVAEAAANGWVTATRRPVVAGSSLTGRFVLTNMGKRALAIAKAA